MANPNLALLTQMAHAMGSLREQVVFVGGCATGLLLTQPEAADVRATEDVDAIVEVFTLAGYHRLAKTLQALGFKQTMEDNTPPFRWFWRQMQLDLVPLEEKVLGFANRWYKPAFAASMTTELAPGLLLKHLSAPYFLATKLWRRSMIAVTTTFTSAMILKTSSPWWMVAPSCCLSWVLRRKMCVFSWPTLYIRCCNIRTF